MPAIRLPRLPQNIQANPVLFQRYWDEVLYQIEKTLNALTSLPVIEQALEAVGEATQNLETLTEVVQESLSTEKREKSLNNSYVIEDGVISADNTGVVTVSSHTRGYGDPVLNPNTSVTGGSLPTTAVPGDIVRIYYEDPNRIGGVVPYFYEIDPAPVLPQSGDTHSVGAVVIPTSGVGEGKTPNPVGYIEL
jgi:hypothetical protein